MMIITITILMMIMVIIIIIIIIILIIIMLVIAIIILVVVIIILIIGIGLRALLLPSPAEGRPPETAGQSARGWPGLQAARPALSPWLSTSRRYAELVARGVIDGDGGHAGRSAPTPRSRSSPWTGHCSEGWACHPIIREQD